MLEFARKVARDASSVTAGDVERLKSLGLTDAEIFDITATAAARAFWTKVIESLGVEADAPLLAMDRDFRAALAAGRAAVAVGDPAGDGKLAGPRERDAIRK